MRIIAEPLNEFVPWWVGKQVTCRNCGRIVELELGDQDKSFFDSQDPETKVNILCEVPGCRVWNSIFISDTAKFMSVYKNPL